MQCRLCSGPQWCRCLQCLLWWDSPHHTTTCCSSTPVGALVSNSPLYAGMRGWALSTPHFIATRAVWQQYFVFFLTGVCVRLENRTRALPSMSPARIDCCTVLRRHYCSNSNCAINSTTGNIYLPSDGYRIRNCTLVQLSLILLYQYHQHYCTSIISVIVTTSSVLLYQYQQYYH